MQVNFLCAVFSSSVKWPVDDTRVSDVFCWIQAKAQYYNPTCRDFDLATAVLRAVCGKRTAGANDSPDAS